MLRLYCTKSVHKSANAIRQEFVDYFTKQLQHDIIRSSPVSLLNDHTTAFVNAGMNQFKGIFLGNYDSPYPRVVNSQKCIRVGGKHSDLNIVGNDTYHHTFFEMLGNWSFGDYFKEESCRYALDLLTGPYNIKKEFLYVTYFGGCEKLGLKPDTECRDIWLSLGIPENRILPFGMPDNFWEMGLSGPCGPCTEIHVDILKRSQDQSARVNAGYPDVIELWNIVFIQYERLANSHVIQPLPKCHVDTGMGLERLVALLQGKRSNYDTDLFQPLFKAIRRSTHAPEYKGAFGNYDTSGIDYGYRILADHARMITVALSDGIIPEKNQKLRRTLRKGIDVGENVFKKKGLLSELSYTVVDILGDAYPELQDNIKKVRNIIKFEEDLYKNVQETCGKGWKKIVSIRPELAPITQLITPGLISGYNEFQSILRQDSTIYSSGIVPGSVAFKLYDSHGLSIDTITELAAVESLQVSRDDFEKEMNNARQKSKIGILKNYNIIEKSLKLFTENHVPQTDDSFKYIYESNNGIYEFPKLKSKIVGLIVNGNIVLEEELKAILTNIDNQKNADMLLDEKSEIDIILSKTNCYAWEGGQATDKGSIYLKDMIFQITNVRKIGSYIVHSGKFTKSNLQNAHPELEDWNDCIVSIDPDVRTSHMRHHTATHLLNAALKIIFPAVYQRNSVIVKNNLKFQFSSFKDLVTLEDIATIERLVNNVIQANVTVKVKTLNLLQLLAENNVTTVPGEIYPDTGIRMIEIDTNELKSKELCCGTHVKSTGFLEHFCVLDYFSKGILNRTIYAITGPLAKAAESTGKNLLEQIVDLENCVRAGTLTNDELDLQAKEIQKKLYQDRQTADVPLPYLIKQECDMRFRNLMKVITKQEKATERASIIREVRNSMKYTNSFIVHHLQSTPKYLSLQDIVYLFPNVPMLLMSYDDKTVRVTCNVPQEFLSNKFNAEIWMKVAFQEFNEQVYANKDTNSLTIVNTKFKNIPEEHANNLIEIAVTKATQYASTLVDKSNIQEN
ncbi:hypothetical protein KPH14_008653 [Odynerus spinipes]|uniref:Alanine--tRNA ligase n=1 Tax=Odynerus spinipes TaxID=1348599 RepID=A0AAD9RSI7_9HYME|nr:hypothetical protein KPH14_008653 [Odynerus spinipes]